ncbi:MAG: replication-relaxation family protein [Verrucomicrobiota bacterium]
MQKRLPRFRRVPIATPLWLEERDWRIIRLVHRHRFLRSDQIAAFIGGSLQRIVRRLQLLFHQGYLERPLAQLESYYRPGSRAIVYGLGNKGEELLEQEFGITPSWRDKNRAVGRMLLEHTLLVADVMVSIELACRKRGDVQVVYEDDLTISTERQPFQWRVTIPNREKLTVIPDFVFALDYLDATGQRQRAYFFLEADRGTMPVKRHALSQTSFYRKLLAYEATWVQDIHRQQLGINRFRVLTVTTIPKRVETLVQACSELKRGQRLFLFANDSILSGDVFSQVWHSGRSGETGTLLG